MNMTMPKGFMSPKSNKKQSSGQIGLASEQKRQDVKDVVKSYFDKAQGGSPYSPNLRLGLT